MTLFWVALAFVVGNRIGFAGGYRKGRFWGRSEVLAEWTLERERRLAQLRRRVEARRAGS